MFKRIAKVRKAGILILALAVILSFSGCGQKNNEDGPDSLLNTQSSQQQKEDLSAEEEGIEFQAKLSYANYAYIDSGDESKDKLIRNVSQTLKVADSDEKLEIEAVLDALKKVPEGVSGAETFVSEAFAVNSMKFSSNTLIIDLSSDGLDSLGMFDEQFYVYQVTDSILNTFPDLEGVRFTVDGSNRDALSYVDISSAFTASDVKAFLDGGKSSSSDNPKESETAKKAEDTTDETSTKEQKTEDAEEEDSQSTDSTAAKSTQKSKSSSTSGSSSNTSQSAGSSSSGSQSSESSSSSSTSNKSSSSGSSSSSASSGKNSSSSGSSASSNKSSSSSGNSSSSNKSNSSGNTSGNQSSSSGSSSNSGSSSGSSSSGSGSSSSTQDGVVNDDDL